MKACPFCAEEIQDAAIKCRHCGSMLSGPVPVHLHREAQSANQSPAKVLTERTSKSLKAQHLVITLVFLLSLLVMIGNCAVAADDGTEISPGATVFLVLGLTLYIVSRVRIWWHHH